VGALVTLKLPETSPVRDLPWIITFGPLTDDEDWEPVVCGPYEHSHALALAEQIVADEDLMAVVEPLMGFAAPDEIRQEITIARATAQVGADEDLLDQFDGLDGLDELDGLNGGAEESFDDGLPREPAPLPSPQEIRAGMARIARRFAD
jgi:hypothetical protein